jgi:hypothetical protein
MTPVEIAALLAAAGARDEALAVVSPGGRLLGLPRRDRWRLVGRAWRLGDSLLGRDGRVYRVGSVIRAVTPPDFPADKSATAQAHRLRQREAARQGFEGDVVNRDFIEVTAADVDAAELEARARLLIDPFG